MQSWHVIEPFMLGFLFLVVAIAVVVLLRRQAATAGRYWAAFARRHGLTLHPPKPPSMVSKRAAVAFKDPGEVTGLIDGLPFRLHVAIHGTRKWNRATTEMTLTIPNAPQGVSIFTENIFSKLFTFAGVQDIATGDDAFDSRFLVKGHDPESVTGWLDQRRRYALLRYWDDELCIKEGFVQFQQENVVTDDDVLDTALRRIRQFLRHIVLPNEWRFPPVPPTA